MTAMIERQESPRRNTCFFRAFVYFETSTTAIECVVRDISDTGARLQFPKRQKFTELLDLYIPVKGQSFHGKVQWDDDDEIGVAFNTVMKADAEDIGLDRRMDRVEAEVSMLRQAVKHLQKNGDNKTEAA
jgi:PilZ domain-containing protein